MWFEFASQTVLDAQLPVGVLADVLLHEAHEGPIPVTVHFSKLPEPGVSQAFSFRFEHYRGQGAHTCLTRTSLQAAAACSLEQCREHFMNTLKQAVFLRCGDMRAYTDLPQSRLDAYWQGYSDLNWEASHWRAVMSDRVSDIATQTTIADTSSAAEPTSDSADSDVLASDGTTDTHACASVPIRLLQQGSCVFRQAQLIIPPFESAGAGAPSWEAKHSRGVVLPAEAPLSAAVQATAEARGWGDRTHIAPSASAAAEASDRLHSRPAVLVQGALVGCEAPLQGLYDTLAHPDGFLYVTLVKHHSIQGAAAAE